MTEPVPTPARGSHAYYRRIFRTAECDTLHEASNRLANLFEDYGWRAVIDVMTEWICAIDYLVPAQGRYRDITGTVRPIWSDTDGLTEERLLTAVIQLTEKRARQDGVSVHESFAQTMDITERLRRNILAWDPFIMAGLRAANASRTRDAVRAVLSRGPGVKERDWWTLRDGATHLYQMASFPMNHARRVGHPLRPGEADVSRIINDRTIPPHMIISLLPPGELSSDC